MRIASRTAFLFIILTASLPNAKADSNMITRDQLEAMFENIRAKTPWDIDGKMLWGYFFCSAI